MEIRKFVKQRDGMYKLKLDTIDILIHEDLILKYGLLVNKNIDLVLLEKIQMENQKYEVYNVALKYIKTRLRSTKELNDILVKKAFSPIHIASTIELLVNQGYLDDKIYVQSFIHDKILMSLYGPLKIRQELLSMGISSVLIDQYLEAFSLELENERIIKIVDKQIKANHTKGSITFKQKLNHYLFTLGYHDICINSALKSVVIDDQSFAKKEYEKIYKKLSRKYSDKELEYKVQQKMYQKGFTNYVSED